MTSTNTTAVHGFAFVCPRCHGPLDVSASGHRCGACGVVYPVRGGVHDFFVESVDGAGSDLKDYTETFRGIDTANSYARSFEEVPRKRWRTRREISVIEDLIGGDPGAEVVNIPCGSGRLSAPLHHIGTALLEADSSPGQLVLNRQRWGDAPGREWMLASAFQLPLLDEAVDTVVCARLSHHLRDAWDRERLLAELLRVARRRVIFSFRNARSITSLWRQLRGRAVHATAMSLEDVRALAARHGSRVVRCRSVSNLGARHSYALIVKAH